MPTHGPQTDYAIVFLSDTALGPQPEDWWDHGNAWHMTNRDLVPHVGPICASVSLRENHWQLWAPRDTFAWWSDGTSNQFVLGEKHIPSGRLGTCFQSGTAGWEDHSGDCSYLATDGWRGGSIGRSFVRRPNSSQPFPNGTQLPITLSAKYDSGGRGWTDMVLEVTTRECVNS